MHFSTFHSLRYGRTLDMPNVCLEPYRDDGRTLKGSLPLKNNTNLRITQEILELRMENFQGVVFI